MRVKLYDFEFDNIYRYDLHPQTTKRKITNFIFKTFKAFVHQRIPHKKATYTAK